MANEDCDPYLKRAINRVWDEYKDYSGIDLSKITHKEDTAWYNAIKYRKSYLDGEDIKLEGALL